MQINKIDTFCYILSLILGSQIIRECFENLKTPNKSENLDKMDQFLSGLRSTEIKARIYHSKHIHSKPGGKEKHWLKISVQSNSQGWRSDMQLNLPALKKTWFPYTCQPPWDGGGRNITKLFMWSQHKAGPELE